MKRRFLSPEEKKALLTQVDEKIKNGMPLGDAVKELKMTRSQFYTWRKVKRLRKANMIHQTIHVPHDEPAEKELVIIQGEASKVQAALDALVKLKGR